MRRGDLEVRRLAKGQTISHLKGSMALLMHTVSTDRTHLMGKMTLATHSDHTGNALNDNALADNAFTDNAIKSGLIQSAVRVARPPSVGASQGLAVRQQFVQLG